MYNYDEKLLESVFKAGGVVTNSSADRDRLKPLLDAGLVFIEEQQAEPGSPPLAPIYRLTEKGRRIHIENITKAGR